MPELMDLVKRYRPSVVWSDGAPATSDYWKAKEFLAWLYNDSPVKDEVVVNDRWGSDADCQHGDFFNCADRFHPNKVLPHKWESCITLDRYSWGYRRESSLADYLSPTVNQVFDCPIKRNRIKSKSQALGYFVVQCRRLHLIKLEGLFVRGYSTKYQWFHTLLMTTLYVGADGNPHKCSRLWGKPAGQCGANGLGHDSTDLRGEIADHGTVAENEWRGYLQNKALEVSS